MTARTPRRITWGNRERFAGVKLYTLSDQYVLITRPRKWGNPFVVADRTPVGHAAVVEEYRRYLLDRPHLVDEARGELAGADLVCACPQDWPCHGDVLLRVANGGEV